MTVPAIPTKYRGITFRSRLEARWAVFFDLLKVRWMYEYEGFQLPSGWYLPDFWLPDLETWIEIKPVTPTEEELAKCSELSISTGKRAILLSGEIGWWLRDLRTPLGCGFMVDADGGGDMPYAPCVCPCCGRTGIEFDGRGARVCPKDGPIGCRHKLPDCGEDGCGDKSYSSDDERIRAAVTVAIGYQFHREG